MARLDDALAELERLLTRTDAPNPQTQAADHAKFVLASRTQTIAVITEVVQLSASDARLMGNADLGREFTQKLQGLRRQAAAVQTTWRTDDIAGKPDEYGKITRAIAKEYAEFCRWAQARLATV